MTCIVNKAPTIKSVHFGTVQYYLVQGIVLASIARQEIFLRQREDGAWLLSHA